MTREEKITAIQANRFPILETRRAAIKDAQDRYDAAYTTYISKIDAANSYYDALVAAGEPGA